VRNLFTINMTIKKTTRIDINDTTIFLKDRVFPEGSIFPSDNTGFVVGEGFVPAFRVEGGALVGTLIPNGLASAYIWGKPIPEDSLTEIRLEGDQINDRSLNLFTRRELGPVTISYILSNED